MNCCLTVRLEALEVAALTPRHQAASLPWALMSGHEVAVLQDGSEVKIISTCEALRPELGK